MQLDGLARGEQAELLRMRLFNMTYMASALSRQSLSILSGLVVAMTMFQSARVAAQPAPDAPPAAAPSAAPPTAPEAAPAPTPPPEPPMVAEPAPVAPPLEPTPTEPVADADAPPPETPAEDPAKKPISVNAWGRVGLYLHGTEDPKKMEHLTNDGTLELHFDGQATEEIGLTGNVVGSYGFGEDQNGTVELLDAIGRFDLADPFHVWVGRMLVPSDRANFSGSWFASPWNYPGTSFDAFIPGPNAPIGPRQGPSGRNDGVTIWGQAAGGLFKYYASAFDLYNPAAKPLWSGRLNLSLINPEPGYYHSSTYYGAKDILAIGVALQAQKDGSSILDDPSTDDVDESNPDDYLGFNADVLFEKDLSGSGVLTLEGAFYKYEGDAEAFDMSWLALVSYLTPNAVGPGKLQPLIRVQGTKTTEGAAFAPDESGISVEAQLGYVIAEYSARLALGYQYSKLGDLKANQIFLGAQILK